MTHYIPAFSPTLGDRQLALCNAWVNPYAHSTAPSCKMCRYLIAEEERQAAELNEGLQPEGAGHEER